MSDNTYALNPITQNKLWKTIESLLNVSNIIRTVWKKKHFKSKGSSINKVVNALAKDDKSNIKKSLIEVEQKWPELSISEKKLSKTWKKCFVAS
ncbi:Hypothetical protein SRAE_0000070000 [Strongyloides ratti]|uniref:MADF domain-containing protein n=1 Tax=Strongyloides ratti TaxID=34506 RepID=A0A090L0B6_STRRB|nr:Hypothetical protein SRAE_0000070000 [Strongyloides ratti]CEF61582.1 Hypothetical protein SRAE_0000070000 [Strongyloides ratti]